MKTTYIYAIVDPADEWEMRYIGKSNEPFRRLRGHLCEALKPTRKQSNRWKCGWINQVLAAGRVPKLLILDEIEWLDKEEWQRVERELIAHYQAEGHRLTNICKGGEGIDSETLRRLLTGVPKTEAHCRSIGIASAKRYDDPEFREANRQKQKDAYSDPELRAKVSAILKSQFASGERQPSPGFTGRKHSDETKAKIGAKGLGRKRSEESVAGTAAAHTGMKRAEETKAKMRAAWAKRAVRARVPTAEELARRSATMKATLAKKNGEKSSP